MATESGSRRRRCRGSGGRSVCSRIARTRFKLSNDPLFVDKVHDIVGLYLNPPERAVVLCVDEKSQIQALDRTAPILPMLPGVPERATHDYKRHGTSSLYAALDLSTGKVLGALHAATERSSSSSSSHDRPRSPAELDVHIVLDNSSTHKTPAIKNGCSPIRGSSCTSRPPRARGSTSSSAGSQNSPPSCSSAAPTAPSLCASCSPARWRGRSPTRRPTRLFICSSATPPGGGVHGMCGYFAA